MAETAATDPLQGLKRMTVLNLVLLSVQGWSGGVVNLFASFPSGGVSGLGAAVQDLQIGGPGPLAILHGTEGVIIVALAIGIAVVSFLRSKARSVRAVSLLGFFFVLVAAIGGFQFLFSGFLDDGSSAQMGGSFLGAYAMYFLVLYYTK